MQGKVMNRWLVVVGGILIQLCLGAIYAWSAFTKKLTAEPFNFDSTQTQWVFSVGLASFAVFMALIAGKWQAKAGPRIVAMTGGVVMGLGYVIAYFSGTSFWGILLGIGLVGGAGIGLAYVCPIACLVKWFPDKKGLITGLAVAGFGFGALIWVKLTQGFIFGPVKLSGDWGGLFGMGWSVNQVWLLYGILFAVLVGLGSLVMINPPEGWQPQGWTPPPASDVSSGASDFTVGEMIVTPQFWGLFLTFVFGAAAGLMVIGVIKLFGMDSLTASGIDEKEAAIATGTAMGLFYALFNGLGRIIWGTVSDFTGRRMAIVLMNVLQGVMMIAFYFIAGHKWGLFLGAALIGFNFGGNFALFPAATADFFGNKKVGTNYPLVFLAYGVGGIIGPLLGGMMRDLGTKSGDMSTWMWAFIPTGLACFVGAVIMIAMRPPKRREITSGRLQPA
ncbi:MAG TPA: MFS transporter [Phycisphaeraceae bacterium]|nr:MFS transporter [Phycisphaeraceae bacterium]